MFEWLASPEAWIALATLASLEIVLGIDNIIFISILVGRLPEKERDLARSLGLGLAMVARLILLFSISWVMGLTEPWFSVFAWEFSGRDLILVGGGLFLLAKATHEIHNSLEGSSHANSASNTAQASFGSILVQIGVLDIVFSLDSVITAVGLSDHVSLMAVAIILSVLVMLFAARPIGDFVDDHPTIKILGIVVSDYGRRDADGGRVRRTCAQRVYLFRNGVFRGRRNAESANEKKPDETGTAA